ncbi:MAG TPA: subclass B1 metallo-beta-lactamase [Thermoanaerobaculia bacterium]|nr:subclass B1 metallo-beta-lactamase [Thermoanaerobaculia bacterium]
MPRILLLLTCIALTACRPSINTPAETPRSWTVSPDLQVTELRPGVWLHTSWQVLSDGTRFPSNGLIVREGDKLVLVDTAWRENRTEELLGWIDSTLRLPIARALITHSHDDRLGGAALLMKRGVLFYAHPLTRQLAAEQGLPLPEALESLEQPGSAVRVGSAEVFYPGPAHSRDNTMVWLPASGVLFGTCAVRAAGSTGLGNVADADVAAWPDAIRRALERYGEAQVVVPGHGEPGGTELLRHTLTLFPPT